jgi:hypothetical protein
MGISFGLCPKLNLRQRRKVPHFLSKKKNENVSKKNTINKLLLNILLKIYNYGRQEYYHQRY